MPTVYQRLTHFEEKSFGFKFPLRHKLNLGALIKKEWNTSSFYLSHPLETVITVENEGTFRVFDYPEFFAPKMDEIIADYVRKITAPKPKKISTKSDEKPPPPLPQKERKIRTRIPLNKPAYTNRNK